MKKKVGVADYLSQSKTQSKAMEAKMALGRAPKNQ